eukprot:5668725-Pleurochrysis_carterae.AAC.1
MRNCGELALRSSSSGFPYRVWTTQPESATAPEPPKGASSPRTRARSPIVLSCIIYNQVIPAPSEWSF